ncbi:hypothetical protein ACJX0J_023175, partial [Zea mays]
MGTATQFEQATMETTGDHGTEGQVDANFALVCTQDWLRRSTPINIQENIEELTIIEKGMFHYFLYNLAMATSTSNPLHHISTVNPTVNCVIEHKDLGSTTKVLTDDFQNTKGDKRRYALKPIEHYNPEGVNGHHKVSTEDTTMKSTNNHYNNEVYSLRDSFITSTINAVSGIPHIITGEVWSTQAWVITILHISGKNHLLVDPRPHEYALILKISHD